MGSKRRGKPLGYYGSGSWAQLFNELKESDAYSVLTPTERLILIDMLRVYNKVSAGGYNIISEGFEYTMAVCLEKVAEATFQKARKRLCEKGFFETPPEIQSLRPAMPTRFMPSREWTQYKATAGEARRIAKYNRAKKKRISEKQRRRSRFQSRMSETQNSKKGMSKVGRDSMSKVGRYEPEKKEGTERNVVDIALKEGEAAMSKVGRSYSIHIPTGLKPTDTKGSKRVFYDPILAKVLLENCRTSGVAHEPDQQESLDAEKASISDRVLN